MPRSHDIEIRVQNQPGVNRSVSRMANRIAARYPGYTPADYEKAVLHIMDLQSNALNNGGHSAAAYLDPDGVDFEVFEIVNVLRQNKGAR